MPKRQPLLQLGSHSWRDGSCYLDAARGQWTAIYYVDGARHKVSRPPGPNRRHPEAPALQAREDLKASLLQRLPLPAGTRTLDQWLDYWWEHWVAGKLADNTLANYSRALGHIRPTLGAYRLTEITPALLQDWLRDLRESGLAPHPLHRAYTVLGIVLHRAVRMHEIPYNPLTALDRPELPPKRLKRALRPEELGGFLKLVLEQEHGVYYATALLTALRRSEVLGLRWCDVDLEAGRLEVTGQWLHRQHSRGSARSAPKSGKPRSVPLIPALRVLLARHKAQAQESCLREGRRWREDWYLFPGRRGPQTPMSAATADKRFRAIREAAGLEGMVLHDLRASCISLLHAEGADDVTLAEIAGHSDSRVTQRFYLELFEDSKQRAMDRLEHLLNPGKAKDETG